MHLVYSTCQSAAPRIWAMLCKAMQQSLALCRKITQHFKESTAQSPFPKHMLTFDYFRKKTFPVRTAQTIPKLKNQMLKYKVSLLENTTFPLFSMHPCYLIVQWLSPALLFTCSPGEVIFPVRNWKQHAGDTSHVPLSHQRVILRDSCTSQVSQRITQTDVSLVLRQEAEANPHTESNCISQKTRK